ncbi:MAG: hypothetical protein ABJO30_14460 [Hyphomicrobiales bacterium]
MEEILQTPVSFWHFLFGLLIAVCAGVLCHVGRAVFNVYPDRLSDSHKMDIIVSSDYSFTDWYYGTEFDDAGFYELYSVKNLRLSIIYNLIFFVVLWFILPNLPNKVAYASNWLASGFGETFMTSVKHYTQK